MSIRLEREDRLRRQRDLESMQRERRRVELQELQNLRQRLQGRTTTLFLTRSNLLPLCWLADGLGAPEGDAKQRESPGGEEGQ